MGRDGCGADCQVREFEGGARVARCASSCVRGGVVIVGRRGLDDWNAQLLLLLRNYRRTEGRAVVSFIFFSIYKLKVCI